MAKENGLRIFASLLVVRRLENPGAFECLWNKNKQNDSISPLIQPVRASKPRNNSLTWAKSVTSIMEGSSSITVPLFKKPTYDITLLCQEKSINISVFLHILGKERGLTFGDVWCWRPMDSLPEFPDQMELPHLFGLVLEDFFNEKRYLGRRNKRIH